MGDNDTSPKAPAPTSLRLTREAVAALDALAAATGGRIARHRLAVAALEHGARSLAADPRPLLALLMGADVLAALGVAVDPGGVVPPRDAPATPVHPPAALVHQPATAAAVGSAPVAARREAAPPPRGRRPVERPPVATPRGRAGARGDATEEEVDRMLGALRGAVERGASVNAITSAAGMNSGGTRRRIAALLDGERVTVSAALARAITEAAERHGR